MKRSQKPRKRFADMCKYRNRVVYNCLGEASHYQVPIELNNTSNQPHTCKRSPKWKRPTIIVPDVTHNFVHLPTKDADHVYPLSTNTTQKGVTETIEIVRTFVTIRIQMEIDSVMKKNEKVSSLGEIIRASYYQFHGVTSVAKERFCRLMDIIRENERFNSLLRVVGRILGVSAFPKLPRYLEELYYELWTWFHTNDVIVPAPNSTTEYKRGKKTDDLELKLVSKLDVISCFQNMMHVKGRHFPPVLLKDVAKVLSELPIGAFGISEQHSENIDPYLTENNLHHIVEKDNDTHVDLEDALEGILQVIENNDKLVEKINNHLFGLNTLPQRTITTYPRDINNSSGTSREYDNIYSKESTLDFFHKLRNLLNKFVLYDKLREGLVLNDEFCRVCWSWIDSEPNEKEHQKHLQNLVNKFSNNSGAKVDYIMFLALLYSQVIETSQILPFGFHEWSLNDHYPVIETEKYDDLQRYMKRLIIVERSVSSSDILCDNLSFGFNHPPVSNTLKDRTIIEATISSLNKKMYRSKRDVAYFGGIRSRRNLIMIKNASENESDDRPKYGCHMVSEEELKAAKNKRRRAFIHIINPKVREKKVTSTQNEKYITAHEKSDSQQVDDNELLNGTNLSFRFPGIGPHKTRLTGTRSRRRGTGKKSSDTTLPLSVPEDTTGRNDCENELKDIFQQTELLDWVIRLKRRSYDKYHITKKEKENILEQRQTLDTINIAQSDLSTCVKIEQTCDINHTKSAPLDASEENHSCNVSVASYSDEDEFSQENETRSISSLSLETQDTQNNKVIAAILIQNFFRSFTREKHQTNEKISQHVENESMHKRHLAVVLIQTKLRGWSTRKYYSRMKIEHKKTVKEELNLQATRIIGQWIIKIYRRRKRNLYLHKSASIIKFALRRRQVWDILQGKKEKEDDGDNLNENEKEFRKETLQEDEKQSGEAIVNENNTHSLEKSSMDSVCEKLVYQVISESVTHVLPIVTSSLKQESTLECKHEKTEDVNFIHLWMMDKWDWEFFFEEMEYTLLKIASDDFRIHNNMNYHRMRKTMRDLREAIIQRRSFIVDNCEESNEKRQRTKLDFPIEKILKEAIYRNCLDCERNVGNVPNILEVKEKLCIPRMEAKPKRQLRFIKYESIWKPIKYTLKK